MASMPANTQLTGDTIVQVSVIGKVNCEQNFHLSHDTSP